MKEYNKKRHFGFAMTSKMHAILFSHLAKEILEEDPKTGEQTIKEAVEHYGYQRGKRMRQRVDHDNEEPNFVNYFVYVEWLSVPGEMYTETSQEGKNFIITAKKCIWQTVWEEFDHVKYGKYYCQYIDPAIMKGYNPSLQIQMQQTKTLGAQNCRFSFKNQSLNEEQKQELKEKREKIGLRDKEPWEYHIAHLYYAFKEILYKEYKKEKADLILSNAIENISRIYGFDFKDLVEEYKNEDFNKARIKK